MREMKDKIYWKKQGQATDPFGISRLINKEVSEAARRTSTKFRDSEGVEYLWIHLAQRDAGLAPPESGQTVLTASEWLNLIDEAASFGTRWLVFYVADALSEFPCVWELSRWAQDTHDMDVAFHYTGHDLNSELVDELKRLDPDRTTLIVTPNRLDAIRATVPPGVRVLAQAGSEENRRERCAGPTRMTCIRADGRMYACGLVVGEDAYAMGHAEARPLTDIAEDETLPHSVEEVENFPAEGCDGCPSRLSAVLSREVNR